MVRNKSQSHEGLNDNRKGNLNDNRQNTKTNRESMDDDHREDIRKSGKGTQSRKGSSPGKLHR